MTAGRSLAGLLLQAERALEQDASEYFIEEQPALARAWEVEEFVDAVDDVRDAVERAATRLDALERTLRAARQAGGRAVETPADRTGSRSTQPPRAEG